MVGVLQLSLREFFPEYQSEIEHYYNGIESNLKIASTSIEDMGKIMITWENLDLKIKEQILTFIR